MIRWKFVLPRLTILLALSLLAWLGTAPALKWSLVQMGQAATGAKVEISELNTSWLRGEVRIQGIEVADPNSAFKNAFVAKEAKLNVDLSELLRKRFVIEQATLTDIAFDQPRETSGQLDPGVMESAEESSPWVESANSIVSDQLNRWIENLADLGVDQLETRLETVQVAKELSRQWPDEYNQMKSRVARLEGQFQRLRGLAEESNRNPLRMAQMVSTAGKDVQLSIREVDELYREVQRLKEKIPSDKQRLMDAKRRDQEKIKQLVKAPKISGEEITQSLFGTEQGEQIQNVLSWVQWIRGVVPNPDKDFVPTRSGGVDVRFGESKPSPALWIREARISGAAPLGSSGQSLAFAGQIENLSTHPNRIDVPVTVDLSTTGAEELTLQAILDRTQSHSVDQISVEIPNRPQRAIRFGSQRSLQVQIPESQSHLQLDVTIIDREIRGMLNVEQRGVKMEVQHVDEKLGGTYVHSLLGSSLNSIDQWDVQVAISGTLDRPKFELKSSLGPQLSQELNHLVERLVDDQRQLAEAYVDRQIEKQMAEINTVFKDVEQLQTAVQDVDRELSRIKQTVTRLLGSRTLRQGGRFVKPAAVKEPASSQRTETSGSFASVKRAAESSSEQRDQTELTWTESAG